MKPWKFLCLAALGIAIALPQSAVSQKTTPAVPSESRLAQSATQSAKTEIVAKFDQVPGNITVTPDGRILVSLHQFAAPRDRVVEVGKDGKLAPFPNLEWSRGRKGEIGLDAVLGIQSDANGVVWMLDNGGRSLVAPRLVAWNTRKNQLERVIPIAAPAIAANSFLNDLAVDLKHQMIYIADTATGGTPALIAVDLKTSKARRVLAGHASVKPENVDLTVKGEFVQIKQPDGKVIKPRIGVNPIALDAKSEWLYYGPMSGSRMYRIPTAALRDPKLSDLSSAVEFYANKPNCDGIAIDAASNIYLGDLTKGAVGILRPTQGYSTLLTEPWMFWVDAFSLGPDGYVYAVENQLHRTAALNAGKTATKPPFYVFRFKAQ